MQKIRSRVESTVVGAEGSRSTHLFLGARGEPTGSRVLIIFGGSAFGVFEPIRLDLPAAVAAKTQDKV